MMDALAKDIISRWDQLDGDRGTWKTHWQDCANYLLPDRSDYITDRAPGQKRMQYVFDATPVWALQQFAAGLHGLLTSPSLQWFSLRTDDDRLNSNQRVTAWLQAATAALYGVFNSPRRNFASQSHELYLDLGSIGTAVMAVLESQRSGVLFSTRHLKECVLAENEEDRIDTCIRRWEFSAKQAVQQWGQAAGEKVLKAYSDKPDTKFPFLHCVRPRRDRNPGRTDKRHKPFESVYVSVADCAEIDVSGFDEFPYLCPRFSKVVGETYGRGPGMTALPDVKMLNEMAKTVLKAAQKVVDPPLQLPDDTFALQIKTVPAGLNFYRANAPQWNRIEPIKTDANIGIGVEMVNGVRQQIVRAFFVEWMLMPSDPTDPAAAGKGVTATFVLQQRDEKMRMLSPMLARLQSEFLGPLIDRTFAILWRRSAAMGFGPGSPFPPPPPELSGVPLGVEYVSPIALAQKSSQLEAVGRLIQTQLLLRNVDPNTPLILDTEAVMRLTGKDLNTPAQLLKSPEQMAAEQQQAAEAQQAMQQHMELASLAQAGKDGAAAAKSLADAGLEVAA